MNESDITVISIFHNRREFVRDSVESLLRQTAEGVLIYLVDDGSTDGTDEELRQLHHPRIRLVSQMNMGFTPALRAAVAACETEFIAIHGSGDISHADRLRRQLEALRGDPRAAFATCHIQDDDGKLSHIYRPPQLSKEELHSQLLLRNPIVHGSVMFRREAYLASGGYREFFTFAQDRDLWLRMSQIGSCIVVPEILYVRRRPAGSIALDARKALQQAYFSAFSAQCAERRLRVGEDYLEAFGTAGALLRPRSIQLANRLAAAGLFRCIVQDDPHARELVEAGFREAKSPATVSAQLALSGFGVPRFWRNVLRPLLRTALRIRARYRRAEFR